MLGRQVWHRRQSSRLDRRSGGGRTQKIVEPYYRGPPSDHFDGTRFFNPDGHKPRNLGDLLKWQLGGGRARWPRAFASPFRSAPEATVAKERCATMVGASLLIQAPGLNILTDPVWSHRVSPLTFIGPQRVNAPGIAFADLPKIDVVLVSHNHYDHLDLATLARLRPAHDPLVVTPLGNDAIIRAAVPGMRIEAGDWGESDTDRERRQSTSNRCITGRRAATRDR